MIHLTLPLAIGRANARLHWRMAHLAKKAYWLRCDNIQEFGKMDGFVCPAPPPRPIPKAIIAATMYVGATHDLDNLMSRTKWTLDWLVTRGYLEDDNPKHLRWVGLPQQIVDRKHQRIVITLAEDDG